MIARATRYPPAGAHIRILDHVWASALQEVKRYAEMPAPDGTPGSEGLVYLGGVVAAGELVVTSVIRLNHAPQGDRVAPSREEIRWLLATLRHRDEKLIAQLHSHRHGSDHSVGDDLMATSFHEGFISIVVPGFGRGVTQPDQCGVHEYVERGFRRLDGDQIRDRVRIASSVVDRQTLETVGEPTEEELSVWHRFAQRLRSIGRRLR